MRVDRLRPCHCASSYRLGWWRACRKAEGNLHKWRLALAELSKKKSLARHLFDVHIYSHFCCKFAQKYFSITAKVLSKTRKQVTNTKHIYRSLQHKCYPFSTCRCGSSRWRSSIWPGSKASKLRDTKNWSTVKAENFQLINSQSEFFDESGQTSDFWFVSETWDKFGWLIFSFQKKSVKNTACHLKGWETVQNHNHQTSTKKVA